MGSHPLGCLAGTETFSRSAEHAHRIIRLTIYVTLATVALSIFKVWFQDAIEFYGEMNSGIFDYFYGFGMNMFYALVITGIYESLYYFHQWQRLLAETGCSNKPISRASSIH